jgi:hypothetical protein
MISLPLENLQSFSTKKGRKATMESAAALDARVGQKLETTDRPLDLSYWPDITMNVLRSHPCTKVEV